MDLISLFSNINLCLKKKKFILLQKRSKIIIQMLDVLWDNKVIVGYRIINSSFIKIYLKFDSSGNSLIKKLFLISKPGKKSYISFFDLNKITKKNNMFLFINTSKGILNYKKALKYNLGGELLLKICI